MKISKFSLLVQLSCLIHNSRQDKKKSNVDQMKTVSSERCNKHTHYHPVKGSKNNN